MGAGWHAPSKPPPNTSNWELGTGEVRAWLAGAWVPVVEIQGDRLIY